jgi:hypothetical protein
LVSNRRFAHGHKDWPRARVLYNTKTQASEVYLNEQLQTPTFEAEILAHFSLPETTTFFASGPHYSEARFKLRAEGRIKVGGRIRAWLSASAPHRMRRVK